MRHRVSHRKLGRVTEHRIAMLRNQATALLKYEHIETTMPKAKELRPFVERIITLAKRGLAAGDAERPDAARAPAGPARHPGSRVVSKLFDTIAPRFETRPGGYTRILRLGYRRGDSAEVAQIELVGSEYDPNADSAKPDAAAREEDQGRRRPPAGRGRAPARQEGRGWRGRGKRSGTPARKEGQARSHRRVHPPSPTLAARPRRPRRRARRGR